MLFPIPIGYFVTVILLISGVLNCVEYLNNKPDTLTAAQVMTGLAEAGWPVIAASVILLLIQINRQLEQLRLQAVYTPAPAGTKAKKNKKQEQTDSPAPASHSAVNLAELARPTHPQVPVYPNSPIPGGGRVPQQPQEADLPSRPEPAPATRSIKRAPSKAEADSLNYFKVD